MTARERIGMLLDKGTFNELDKLVNHRCTNFGMEKKQIAGDGMVTGYGKIDGRPVFVYAYDFTAHSGSLSETNAAKIVKVQQLALKRRSRHRPERLGRRTHPRRGEQPCRICLYFLSEHYRPRCYPADFRHLGSLCRRSLLLTSTNRFYLYGKEKSHMFITGPDVVKTVTNEEVGKEELGGAYTHSSKSGVTHFMCDNEEETLMSIRKNC